MGLNIKQIHTANPSTSLPLTALLYAGLSPFSITNDSAITFDDFQTQIITNSAGFFLPLIGGALTGAVTTTSTLQFKTLQYTTGTISQSGFFLTGTGTAFTNAMTGGWMVPSSGSAQRILNVNGGTSLIMSLSQTIAAGTTFTVYYGANTNYLDQDQAVNATIFANTGFALWGSSTSQFINNGLWITRKGFYADNNATASPYFPGVSVSQSGTTVTGVGTSFPANYKGRLMIFSTGQSAFITAVNSTVSLTVATSQTVPSTSFFVAGQASAATTCMDGFGNFGANNLYVYSTLNFPGGTFSVGANTAFTGAFTTSLTASANTTLALPGSSGTLALTSQIPSVTPAALTKTDDTNVTLTLGGSPSTALLQASSLTLGWTGQLSAARGGTGANNTATSGTLLRGNGTTFVPTTTTYPATNAINTIPYASAANVMGVIAAVNNAALITDATGIPSLTALGNLKVLGSNSSGVVAGRTLSINTVVVSATGTYTPSTGCVGYSAEVLGGGGGGGGTALTTGSQFSAAAGAGAGEYVFVAYTTTLTPVSVTIASGGGGATAGANNGATGGTATFGSITALGGVGGTGRTAQATGSSTVGSLGGSGGTGGTLRIPGAAGGTGNCIFAGGVTSGGYGANSKYGNGGLAVVGVAGANAGGYGAGGSGASAGASAAAFAGGNGSPPVVIVTEIVLT